MTDLFDRVSAALAGRYQIQRELGQGGMATVYLADDRKQPRLVAIKVFKPELAALVGPDRFLREIEITSRLNHPHIIPLLESGQADGLLYYVMPYLDGESLRRRLDRERQLPITDALQIARDVAGALASAHGQGFVHRDIKPENILFREGHAVVADFGVARAVAAAGSTRLTATGFAVGTPAYMSPEQTHAEVIDGRSDLYSLACVLYEMLSGDPPHAASTPEAIIARKLAEPVPSLRIVRESVPEELERVILRALSIMPADRYSTMQELVAALDAAAARKAGPPTGRPVRPYVRLSFGAGAGLASIVAPLAWFVWPLLSEPRIDYGGHTKSLAVLYFDDQGPQPAGIRLGDALTEELISRLARVRTLRVLPPLDVVRFRQGPESTEEIGRELGVDAVLEGTVSTVDSQLVVSAQLLDAEHGFVLWSDVLRGELEQLFDVQNRITRSIVNALSLELSRGERQNVRRNPTTRFQAYQLFLRGHGHLARWGEADVDSAIALFAAAVQEDGAFAEAHAYLAFAYLTRAYFGYGSRTEGVAQVRAHSERALALDPNNEVALVSSVGQSLLRIRRGEHLNLWQLRGMTVKVKRIVKRNPDSPLGNLGVAHYYMWLKRDTTSAKPLLRHAFSRADAALRVEPQNQFLRGIAAEASGLLAVIASTEGNFKGAIELSELSLGYMPNVPRTLSQLARYYQQVGQYDRAVSTLRQAVELLASPTDRGREYLYLGAALYRMRRFGDAREAFATAFGILDRVADPSRDYPLVYWAILARRLGDTTEVQRLLRARADDGKGDAWIRTVLRLYAGQLEAPDVIRAAKRRWQQCEGYYFLGAHALQEGRTEDARRYFESSVATGVTSYLEYDFARVELELLGSAR